MMLVAFSGHFGGSPRTWSFHRSGAHFDQCDVAAAIPSLSAATTFMVLAVLWKTENNLSEPFHESEKRFQLVAGYRGLC